MVFDSISSNIDDVLLINPSANVFVFGDFNVQLCYNFSLSSDLTQILNFPKDTVINVVPNADIFRYSQFSTEYGRMFT